MGIVNWIIVTTLGLTIISKVCCDDTYKILSYVDLEGEKGFKFEYSDLLHKTPVEDQVEMPDNQETQDNSGDKRQFWESNGTPHLWPKKTIPYRIDEVSYPFTAAAVKTVVEQAVEIWSNATCIKFWDITDPNHKDWKSKLGHAHFTNIRNDRMCGSYIGFQIPYAESQTLKLHETGCMRLGTVLHEMGHLLGLAHEQTRADRDSHVTIQLDNVRTNYQNNFFLLNTLDVTNFDYSSIMHYGVKDFSANMKNAMTLKQANLEFLTGQRNYLTFYDAKAVNLVYECNAHCSTELTCQNDGYIGPNCVCVCPSVLSGDTCNTIAGEYNHSGCNSDVYTLKEDDFLEILSPHFPRNYGSKKCAWLVKGPVGENMTIGLSLNDIPRNQFTHRCYHSIEIRSNILGQQGLSFCGFTNSPYFFESIGDAVLIILHGDEAGYKGKSFKVEIKSGNRKSACVPNPCTGFGQTCVEVPNSRNHTCECMENLAGDDCSVIKFITCNFDFIEGPLQVCLFSQNKTDQLDWLRYSKHTRSAGTGPDSGVGGTGSYMYMESSSPARPGYEAILDSAIIAGGAKCLSFYYSMYGNSMGELYVSITSALDPNPTTVWMKAGNQGEGWKTANITVDMESDFKIHIRAVRGSSFRSDIGIDSVSVRPGPCPETTRNIPCPLHYTGVNCDMIDDAFCNFDSSAMEDFCIFTNDTGDFYWQKHGGQTDTEGTGPNDDKSGGKYYILAEASDHEQGQVARLTSLYIAAGTVCFHFELHMHGVNMGEFVIILKDASNQSSTRYIKDTYKGWKTVSFTVRSKEKFKVVIEAVRGSGPKSDIAIDDLVISRRDCEKPDDIVILE